MKQIMRIMGLCALVAVMATSCEKKEVQMSNTLTAVLNQPTSGDKTQIGDDNYLVWSPNDQILVGDQTLSTQTFTAMSSGSTHTDFTGGTIDPTQGYWAFYPVEWVTNVDVETERITFEVPTTQTYVEGSFATNTYPMAGSNGGSGTEFTFQGLFGVLAIPLKGNCTVGSIELTDAAYNLTGSISYLAQTLFESSDSKGGKSAGRTITLDCGDGVTLSRFTPTTFMFSLRPIACSRGFTITVKDTEGEVIATRTAASNLNNAIRPEKILWMPVTTINVEE